MLNGMIKQLWQLCRLDKPIGTILLLLPCLWGLSLGTQLVDADHSRPYYWYMQMQLNAVLLALGAVFLRSAGCIINDLWDRKIDAQVARTKHRPLASGAVKPWQAMVLLGVLLLSGLAVLAHFPWRVVWLGIASVPLVIAYPLMKRFFPLPQLFLGLVFNWGVLLGAATVDRNILSQPAVWLLYIAAICWTLAYDTIYACQDIPDDTAAGVKSSALFFGKHIKTAVLGSYAVMFGLLAIAMGLAGYSLVNIGGVLPIAAATLWLTWQRFNPQNPAACLKGFKVNGWLGVVMLVLLLY